MSVCEKCWGDAYLRMLDTGKPQEVCYKELLEERKDNPCPPEKDVEGQDISWSDYLNDPSCPEKDILERDA